MANPKIKPVWNSTISEYLTDEKGEMRAAKLKNLVTGEESELEVKCVFVAIGHIPNAQFLNGLVDVDENGYIVQTRGTLTKTEGLFAAGDVADHVYRQAITAAGQGCAAALEAERYLAASGCALMLVSRFFHPPASSTSRRRMIADPAFLLADLSSLWTVESMLVILSLILIEGLLSVDNALAIAAMASHLDEKKRKLAMNIGYAGAYGFRILALFIASYIVNNHWLMILGSAYLIWLMCNHFAEQKEAGFDEGPDVHSTTHSFGKTIAMIAFLDLSLSFDNVVAAVGLAGKNITLVYVGVTIGIITLRLVAGYCIKLLERHPWLEHTAFLLVGFVGLLLCAELWWDMRDQAAGRVARHHDHQRHGRPLSHRESGEVRRHRADPAGPHWL